MSHGHDRRHTARAVVEVRGSRAGPAAATERAVADALLQGAEAVGLLRARSTATTTGALAEATGLTEERVRDVCAALLANEVAVQDSSGVRLVPARSAAELVEEVTAAGFTDAVTASTPGTGISVVAATRP